MLVFATETSCDETSICLMDNKEIVEHIVFSQEIHNKFGGVVPELASRSHLEKLQEITQDTFSKKNIDPNKINFFSATCGPGLIGSLLIGATFTKALSIRFKKPFIPINHLEAHVLSTSYNNDIKYPSLVLLLTGGHTQLYLMLNNLKIKLLGESVDDAIGEAFDKTAKLLGLSYPGGSEIEKKALEGDPDSFDLPKPLVNEKTFNFSFSGIKTKINLLTKKISIDETAIKNISASFQKTITDLIVMKLNSAIETLNQEKISIKSISIVGGVANNKYIRSEIESTYSKKHIEIYYPIKEMMADNAAMIAWTCFKKRNQFNSDIFFKPDPRMKIDIDFLK